MNHFLFIYFYLFGLPGSSAGKESCNAGDPGLIPGLGRSTGEGIGLPAPVFVGFPAGSDTKESACNVGDLGSISGSGRSHGEGNGYPLQYSFISVCVSFILFLNLLVFRWPCRVFAVACGIFSWDRGAHSCGRWDQFPERGLNMGPVH